jgi:hypothetical protein
MRPPDTCPSCHRVPTTFNRGYIDAERLCADCGRWLTLEALLHHGPLRFQSPNGKWQGRSWWLTLTQYPPDWQDDYQATSHPLTNQELYYYAKYFPSHF